MIYETTDIKLGAVILCEIPGSFLAGVDSEKFVNSKRVVLIDYPAQYERAMKKITEDYARKLQMINVYQYNRALCTMRDALRQNGVENGNRRQAEVTVYIFRPFWTLRRYLSLRLDTGLGHCFG